MAESVVPGVWWLHGTRGSNVYLIEASDGRRALIDSGFDSSAAGILEELRLLDTSAPGRRPTHLLLTHSHSDHAGAARVLRDRLALLVLAGRSDCVPAEGDTFILREAIGRSHLVVRVVRLARRTARFLLRRRRSPRAPSAAAPATPVDLPLDGEVEVLPGILAVPVPGHTPGSYCYLDLAKGVAFVGDLVISHRDGLARTLPFSNVDDARYLEALAAFAQRAPEVGCPGHGHPLVDGFGQQLRALGALPRRSMLSPRAVVERARRLRKFSIELSRTRRPTRSEDDRG